MSTRLLAEVSRYKNRRSLASLIETPLSNSKIAMSIPTTSHETYPGRDYSLPQLLSAAKKKLHHATFGEW